MGLCRVALTVLAVHPSLAPSQAGIPHQGSAWHSAIPMRRPPTSPDIPSSPAAAAGCGSLGGDGWERSLAQPQ